MLKEIEIEGLKICYEETGTEDGEPVVILHGWGCDHTTVKSIGDCLASKMKVFSIDLPGHGKSDEPKEIWGSDNFADIIWKFISKLGIENPSLIGHSFGGRTILAMASEAGSRKINKIVLVDAAGITPKRTLKYYYKVYSYKAFKKLVKTLLGNEKGQRLIEKRLKKKGSADYQSATPMMRAIMSKCINEDLRKRFPNIKASTLLIWGENDTATPVSDAKIMEKGIPDAGLVTFPNCGHYSFLDNPYGFKSVLREFFKPELNHQ